MELHFKLRTFFIEYKCSVGITRRAALNKRCSHLNFNSSKVKNLNYYELLMKNPENISKSMLIGGADANAEFKFGAKTFYEAIRLN